MSTFLQNHIAQIEWLLFSFHRYKSLRYWCET
uniref:Uncharacterized protein n=1 Tax=Anguilla anguilla TaxID=7936 RepID=A0A0E9PSK6_ANGAN